MARDWETTLQGWIKPASDSEDDKRDRTQRAISDALGTSSLPMKKIRVYAKGSYANNTNVRNDSDVDIAVEYYEMVFSEAKKDLAGATKAELGLLPSTDPYNQDMGAFKSDVEDALVGFFGRDAVKHGDKSLTLPETNRSHSADVIPCFEFRRYTHRLSSGKAVHHQGSTLFPDSGGQIVNWPQQQYDEGVAKNERTGRRYKRMVRALKRLENELVEEGLIEELPSYFIECLVFNVPDEQFDASTLQGQLRSVLATIFNETLGSGGAYQDWVEVNWMKWLFRAGQGWTVDDAHRLAAAAWDYVGFD